MLPTSSYLTFPPTSTVYHSSSRCQQFTLASQVPKLYLQKIPRPESTLAVGSASGFLVFLPESCQLASHYVISSRMPLYIYLKFCPAFLVFVNERIDQNVLVCHSQRQKSLPHFSPSPCGKTLLPYLQVFLEASQGPSLRGSGMDPDRKISDLRSCLSKE